jgi:hypothetical protein
MSAVFNYVDYVKTITLGAVGSRPKTAISEKNWKIYFKETCLIQTSN